MVVDIGGQVLLLATTLAVLFAVLFALLALVLADALDAHSLFVLCHDRFSFG